MPKINKRLIEAAEARDKAYDINDSELRGFGVYVLPSGTRSFFVRYRLGGRRRRVSIGYCGVVTPEKARAQAMSILARVRNGEDPAADQQTARKALTVAAVAERFDAEHIAVRLKPSTAEEYRLPPHRPATPLAAHPLPRRS